jgi:hypothetical protein
MNLLVDLESKINLLKHDVIETSIQFQNNDISIKNNFNSNIIKGKKIAEIDNIIQPEWATTLDNIFNEIENSLKHEFSTTAKQIFNTANINLKKFI